MIGYCITPDVKLSNVAERVTRGDVSALATVGGSCVVIAVRPNDVVVAGDLAGQRVVFYARTPDGEVLLGSHASHLAPFVGNLVDRDWLAARLLLPNASDVWWTGSPWHRVEALRPGWALHVSRSGQVTVRRLTMLSAPSSGIQEAGSALRSALVSGVRGRVAAARTPTADLSGGLDSSTLAVLAAGVVSESLPAITLTVRGVNDAEVAAEVARDVSGLVHEQWPVPDSVLPYSQLDTVPVPDEPASYAANASRALWWLRNLAERGSDLHLSGDGGDAVLQAPPAYLAELMLPRLARESWRHISGWAGLRHQAPHALARAAIALRRTSYREALRTEANRLVAGEPGPSEWTGLVAWFGHSRIVEWMTQNARRIVADQLHHHAGEHSVPVVPGEFGVGDATAWLALTTSGRTQRLYTDMAAACGVNHHAPYLDDAVVRACWSVPTWVRTTPEDAKPLLWHAVSDLVPARMIERRTKGDYTALAYRGLRRNAATLHDLFTGSRLGELGLIDDQAVRATIDSGAAGVRIRLGAFDTLVSTELWLRGQDQTAHCPRPLNGGNHASAS